MANHEKQARARSGKAKADAKKASARSSSIRTGADFKRALEKELVEAGVSAAKVKRSDAPGKLDFSDSRVFSRELRKELRKLGIPLMKAKPSPPEEYTVEVWPLAGRRKKA